jgi:hypothetical protein
MRGPRSRRVFMALALLLGATGALSSGAVAESTAGLVTASSAADAGPVQDDGQLAASGLLFPHGVQISGTTAGVAGSPGTAVVGGRRRGRARAGVVPQRPCRTAVACHAVRRGTGLLGMDASPANAPPRS